MAHSKKPAPAKSTASAKKSDAHEKKPAAPAKAAAAHKSAPTAKANSAVKTPPPSAQPAEPPASKAKMNDKISEKVKARDALRSRILGNKKPAKPIAFSLDEVREIAKTVAVKSTETEEKGAKAGAHHKAKAEVTKAAAKPAQPNHVKAASLADILGFNPRKPNKSAHAEDESDIPEKFRRYYRLLIELRNHVTGQLDQHTEDTLKRSSKDDAGDLSSYGQHMADAGTDTFDRDFALSLVSSEQEALSEIEAAIQRIRAGTYGICEITQKPIAKERLLAVPFTRYSAEAQKEIERNRYRSRTGAGLFGEMGEEGGSMGGGDDGGDD